jgi:hypothetical protein
MRVTATPVKDDAFVQLTTRIPKALHRKLKVYCVTTGTPLMTFVLAAKTERLTRHNAHGPR